MGRAWTEDGGKQYGPSTDIEASPVLETQKAKIQATIILEPRPVDESSPRTTRPTIVREEGSFQSSMLEYNRMKSGSRFLDLLIAITLHGVVIDIPIFLGLYFTDLINLKQIGVDIFGGATAASSATTSRGTSAESSARSQGAFENVGKLIAPTVVPEDDCRYQGSAAAR